MGFINITVQRLKIKQCLPQEPLDLKGF